MSVKVQELSKCFGEQNAVSQVNFEVHKGEILGFLGPNGAGKSTTMKMLTGLLTPTSGQVEICGERLREESVAIKKKIGYLPENNPLYYDMFVHEYLLFVAGLYDFTGIEKSKRVKEMVGLCGLDLEQNKKIGTLSKGYKQRVGLAQALIHDPEILILDEPNTGLDPNQLVEIRELIKGVSQNKTVVFSTHIMQEVEAICDRVLIINKGELIVDQTIQDLQGKVSNVSYEVSYTESVSDELLNQMSFISGFKRLDNRKIQLNGVAHIDSMGELIFQYAVSNSLVITEMTQRANSLEEVFHQLTRNK